MIYKINDYIYKKKNKYTFKEEIFLNNNKRLVYCFVAIKDGVIDCLLQSIYNGFKNDEKDKAINDYLSGKTKTIDCDYSKLSNNAKPLIEIVSSKIG